MIWMIINALLPLVMSGSRVNALGNAQERLRGALRAELGSDEKVDSFMSRLEASADFQLLCRALKSTTTEPMPKGYKETFKETWTSGWQNKAAGVPNRKL